MRNQSKSIPNLRDLRKDLEIFPDKDKVRIFGGNSRMIVYHREDINVCYQVPFFLKPSEHKLSFRSGNISEIRDNNIYIKIEGDKIEYKVSSIDGKSTHISTITEQNLKEVSGKEVKIPKENSPEALEKIKGHIIDIASARSHIQPIITLVPLDAAVGRSRVGLTETELDQYRFYEEQVKAESARGAVFAIHEGTKITSELEKLPRAEVGRDLWCRVRVPMPTNEQEQTQTSREYGIFSIPTTAYHLSTPYCEPTHHGYPTQPPFSHKPWYRMSTEDGVYYCSTKDGKGIRFSPRDYPPEINARIHLLESDQATNPEVDAYVDPGLDVLVLPQTKEGILKRAQCCITRYRSDSSPFPPAQQETLKTFFTTTPSKFQYWCGGGWKDSVDTAYWGHYIGEYFTHNLCLNIEGSHAGNIIAELVIQVLMVLSKMEGKPDGTDTNVLNALEAMLQVASQEHERSQGIAIRAMKTVPMQSEKDGVRNTCIVSNYILSLSKIVSSLLAEEKESVEIGPAVLPLFYALAKGYRTVRSVEDVNCMSRFFHDLTDYALHLLTTQSTSRAVANSPHPIHAIDSSMSSAADCHYDKYFKLISEGVQTGSSSSSCSNNASSDVNKKDAIASLYELWSHYGRKAEALRQLTQYITEPERSSAILDFSIFDGWRKPKQQKGALARKLRQFICHTPPYINLSKRMQCQKNEDGGVTVTVDCRKPLPSELGWGSSRDQEIPAVTSDRDDAQDRGDADAVSNVMDGGFEDYKPYPVCCCDRSLQGDRFFSYPTDSHSHFVFFTKKEWAVLTAGSTTSLRAQMRSYFPKDSGSRLAEIFRNFVDLNDLNISPSHDQEQQSTASSTPTTL